MDAPLRMPPPSIGFLSIRERNPHGYFGGYLVVNELARPLEFHCTLPLQPTRAQQILFGDTLKEFVCGEQIARALLLKGNSKPGFVLTDCHAVLAVRHWVDLPVFVLDSSADGRGYSLAPESPGDDFRIPSAFRDDDDYATRTVAGYSLRWLKRYANDGVALESLPGSELGSIDLHEPFGRIVEALAEAHPRSKAA